MKPLKVIFLSQWRGNPYKDLLAQHLTAQKVEVEEHPWELIFLPQVLWHWKPNILHLHVLHAFFIDTRSSLYTFIKFVLFASQLLVLKLVGIKVAWTVHELTDKLYLGKGNIPSNYASVIGELVDIIFTHCKSTKLDVVSFFSIQQPEKVFVIPNGNYIGCFPNQITQTEARRSLAIPPEKIVFLCFGHIYRYKGTLETIDAFNRLNDEDAYLVIAGEPKEGLKDELLEKTQGANNILLIPKVIPDHEIQIYMNACDCVMSPYLVFTTSGIATLAMSFKRPCIAPKVGYFSDTLDEAGAFFYNPTDAEGLLDAMKSAVHQRHRLSQMGDHNFELAQQHSWDYVADRTQAAYCWSLETDRNGMP